MHLHSVQKLRITPNILLIAAEFDLVDNGVSSRAHPRIHPHQKHHHPHMHHQAHHPTQHKQKGLGGRLEVVVEDGGGEEELVGELGGQEGI